MYVPILAVFIARLFHISFVSSYKIMFLGYVVVIIANNCISW